MAERQLRDPFGARAVLETPKGPLAYYRLAELEEQGIGKI